jgi:hypothetical protein
MMGAAGMSNIFMTTTGAAMRLGPCKLEVGSKATPMLRQSFQQELARCQRYYEKSYNPGVAIGTNFGNTALVGAMALAAGGTNGYGIQVAFKTTKRALPTLFQYAFTGAGGNLSVIQSGSWVVSSTGAVQASNFNGFTLATSITSAITGIAFDWVADARL